MKYIFGYLHQVDPVGVALFSIRIITLCLFPSVQAKLTARKCPNRSSTKQTRRAHSVQISSRLSKASVKNTTVKTCRYASHIDSDWHMDAWVIISVSCRDSGDMLRHSILVHCKCTIPIAASRVAR